MNWGVAGKIKYLLCPGMVDSAKDRDSHYISAKQLMVLYRVRPDECVVDDDRRDRLSGADREWLAELIVLAPRFDGDYSMPVARVRDSPWMPRL